MKIIYSSCLLFLLLSCSSLMNGRDSSQDALANSAKKVSVNLNESNDPAFKIVNRKISLGNYAPQDLVKLSKSISSAYANPGIMVSKRIIPDLLRLLKAAKKDGLHLKVVSGYRSYERQAQTFERWIQNELKRDPAVIRQVAKQRADRYSAQAGHSEHQLGTTVDILSAENGFLFSSNEKLHYVGWLERNAPKFNFKISYPKDGTEYEYEPWHLRWYPARKK